MGVQAWAASDVGRKRKHNEDSFLVDPSLGLYVVADGMGGHAAGNVASARCVELVRESLLGARGRMDALAHESTPQAREAAQIVMERAIEHASSEIYRMARSEPTMRGMGTTCVAMLVSGRKIVLGHVGDSRAYLLRNGRAHQLTEDHSLIQEQLKRGIITRAEAERSEVRNVITRAVGIQASVQVDTLVADMLPGDLFMLCSDGLHGYLREDELAGVLSHGQRPDLPRSLVALANERGGKDNITALVVSADAAPAAPEDDEETDVEGRTEILRRIPLFQYMTYKELLAILSIAQARKYVPGEVIIREGEAGDDCFVLFRGKVDVIKEGAAIATLRSGGHFGEMALIDHAPRSATVQAAESVNAVSIDRDSLLKLMRKDSLLSVKLLWSFLQVLSERLRTSNEALSGLKGEVERLRGEATAPGSVPAPRQDPDYLRGTGGG